MLLSYHESPLPSWFVSIHTHCSAIGSHSAMTALSTGCSPKHIFSLLAGYHSVFIINSLSVSQLVCNQEGVGRRRILLWPLRFRIDLSGAVLRLSVKEKTSVRSAFPVTSAAEYLF